MKTIKCGKIRDDAIFKHPCTQPEIPQSNAAEEATPKMEQNTNQR